MVLLLITYWINCFIFFLFNNGKIWNYEFASDYNFDDMPLMFLLNVFLAIVFYNNQFEYLFDLRVCKRLVCINDCIISTNKKLEIFCFLIINFWFIFHYSQKCTYCILLSRIFLVSLWTNRLSIFSKYFIVGWQKIIFC